MTSRRTPGGSSTSYCGRAAARRPHCGAARRALAADWCSVIRDSASATSCSPPPRRTPQPPAGHGGQDDGVSTGTSPALSHGAAGGAQRAARAVRRHRRRHLPRGGRGAALGSSARGSRRRRATGRTSASSHGGAGRHSPGRPHTVDRGAPGIALARLRLMVERRKCLEECAVALSNQASRTRAGWPATFLLLSHGLGGDANVLLTRTRGAPSAPPGRGDRRGSPGRSHQHRIRGPCSSPSPPRRRGSMLGLAASATSTPTHADIVPTLASRGGGGCPPRPRSAHRTPTNHHACERNARHNRCGLTRPPPHMPYAEVAPHHGARGRWPTAALRDLASAFALRPDPRRGGAVLKLRSRSRAPLAAGEESRTVFDAQNGTDLPAPAAVAGPTLSSGAVNKDLRRSQPRVTAWTCSRATAWQQQTASKLRVHHPLRLTVSNTL